ncbi:MAG: M14 family metallopeptidase [Chloroflexota bacterium]
MAYELDFSEYFLFDQLTEHLHALAASSELATLESLGKSHRGRDVWCMTITNPATGPHHEKPAFYIDGHIHAEEVATSHTALYTIWYLLEHYNSDDMVTWLLDNTTFYIIPRMNPDGAEISLTTGHHWCGNGRYLPGEEQTAGLVQHDINGDGLIVQMRIEDPAGEWKVSEKDPRIMVQRPPGEVGSGPYYRLYREGEVRGEWDGVNFEIQQPRDGNLNRNFPAGWRPAFRQYGAGDLPLGEPETNAVARFILDHPNISGMQCYHTHGGLHLRPSLVAPDDTLPRHDLALYKRIGQMGTELTGYPVISVYEEFTNDPDKPRVGSLMQWSYDEFGIITFSTELWNPELAAGAKDIAKYQIVGRSEDKELTLMALNDEHMGGAAFVDWHEFDHPQFGTVEIGGWTHMYLFRNPPPASMATTKKGRQFLQDTIHTNCLFTLRHAACTPLIRVESVETESLGADLYKVSAIVANTGFLPTFMTERALAHDTAKPVQVNIAADGEILMGRKSTSIGHLAGRDERTSTWSPWLRQWSDTKKKLEWLVRAPEGGSVTVTANAQRGGVHHAEVTL